MLPLDDPPEDDELVLPLEDPVPLEPPLHAFETHVPPTAVQSSQLAPPEPQSVSVAPGWQVPLLSQHPVGHVHPAPGAPLLAPPLVDELPPGLPPRLPPPEVTPDPGFPCELLELPDEFPELPEELPPGLPEELLAAASPSKPKSPVCEELPHPPRSGIVASTNTEAHRVMITSLPFAAVWDGECKSVPRQR
jgi:hypothetical protein